MSEKLSDALLKIVLMALAFCCAVLLLRNSMVIGLKVPLDPNEGWNAYHALAAMTGQPLYPREWMVNNYPPLSFYIVGALGRSLGDMIVAGRLVSLLSFLAIAMGLAALLRQVGARVLDSIFAALLFAAALLITSNYVAMADPQLLGHALQIEALLLLFRTRPRIILAALLLVGGLFIKHSLIALPLAALLWLVLRDRRQALRLGAYGLGFAVAGLITAWSLLGVNLPIALASPRLWSLANLITATTHILAWGGVPLLLLAALGWRFRADSGMRFCLLYGAISLVLGIALSAGDGVDANIFFDLIIALALGFGLALSHAPAHWRGPLVLACTLPLALFWSATHIDTRFAYSEGFQKQAPLDIAFLQINSGPALCENLALCYWADKDAAVDVFNISQQFKTGARDDAGLVRLLNTRFFHAIQLDTLEPFALGARARAALTAHYRVDHIDDNGVFLIAR